MERQPAHFILMHFGAHIVLRAEEKVKVWQI